MSKPIEIIIRELIAQQSDREGKLLSCISDATGGHILYGTEQVSDIMQRDKELAKHFEDALTALSLCAQMLLVKIESGDDEDESDENSDA